MVSGKKERNQKGKGSTQFFPDKCTLLIPTTKPTYLLSYLLNSVLSGTKHVNWPEMVQEEVTEERGVPLPGDICSFTEVAQILNALMLLGSKSGC